MGLVQPGGLSYSEVVFFFFLPCDQRLLIVLGLFSYLVIHWTHCIPGPAPDMAAVLATDAIPSSCTSIVPPIFTKVKEPVCKKSGPTGPMASWVTRHLVTLMVCWEQTNQPYFLHQPYENTQKNLDPVCLTSQRNLSCLNGLLNWSFKHQLSFIHYLIKDEA